MTKTLHIKYSFSDKKYSGANYHIKYILQK